MMWKIQVWNFDIHDGWTDYDRYYDRFAVLEFETKEAAEKERRRLALLWTSMFKRSRVVPVGTASMGLRVPAEEIA